MLSRIVETIPQMLAPHQKWDVRTSKTYRGSEGGKKHINKLADIICSRHDETI